LVKGLQERSNGSAGHSVSILNLCDSLAVGVVLPLPLSAPPANGGTLLFCRSHTDGVGPDGTVLRESEHFQIREIEVLGIADQTDLPGDPRSLLSPKVRKRENFIESENW
jgi:hypothetical protein